MIWTDWGENKIEYARLDGSGRHDLVKTNVGYPNGVSYDFASGRVYWCDAKTDKIEFVDLLPNENGVRARGEVPIKKGGIVHPFGITVFNDYIYWTDWGKRAILRTDTNGTEIVTMRSPHLSLMGLRVYNKGRQTGISLFTISFYIVLLLLLLFSFKDVYTIFCRCNCTHRLL